MSKGPYIALEEDDEAFGLAFALVYMKERKDLQVCIKVGQFSFAIGWMF